jgi:Type I phosphodiesterase / nucleotide pyrophosphatase
MSRGRQIIVAGAGPGILAGVLLAGLLFFLEPRLPFSFLAVGRAALLYAALLAPASLLLHLPWTSAKKRRPLRALPWVVCAVLAAFAFLDWSHASYFAYYLPPGINERLFKAGFWMLGGAVGCFYTALLHQLQHRRYGWRSRTLLVGLVGCCVLAQLERRDSFRRPLSGLGRPSMADVARQPRVLVVGLESATLDAVLPLAEQGELPFFRSLLESGAAARLRSMVPTRRTPLWTVLATGKYPFRHGVVGSSVQSMPALGSGMEMRILPRGIGFGRWGTFGARSRRVDGRDRNAATLWEVLSRIGASTGVIGWPATSPAAAEAKFVVSDRFFTDGAAGAPESVWPRELADRAKLFREPTGGSYWSFPGGNTKTVAAALRGDEWRTRLSLQLLGEQAGLEALVVVLPGLAVVSRQFFGGFTEVQFEGGPGAGAEAHAAARVISNYYQGLDRFLAEAWESGRFELLAVVSASGVEGAKGWRRAWGRVSKEEQLRGRWNNGPDGLLLMRGAGVRAGALVPDAGIEDVLPTLLYAADLPVARDLDGGVLAEVFEPGFLATNPIRFLASYEALNETRPAGDSED